MPLRRNLKEQLMRQSFFKFLSLSLLVSTAAVTSLDAKVFWTERDASGAPIVNLPNLGPIIDQVDAAVVNIATSSEPKKAKVEKRRRGAPEQMPMDPFSNPEEFFERFFGSPLQDRPQQPRRSLGSGFIISKDGYIVTNNHVIDGADTIEVNVFSGEGNGTGVSKGDKFQAKLIGRDPATDLALIKIDAKKDLVFVPLGNSTKVRKGDWALAFGNPFGLDHSVSLGIISATGREINMNENRRFDDFIQTDAAINFGNSGGPLINLKGEVIGVNTAITAQGSGIGFAVPVNILKDVLPQLKDSGSVSRGYLGVMIQDVSEEIREALGLSTASGVVINDLVANGPAAKSQLQRGDVIIKIGDRDIPNSRELQKTIANLKPGASINMHVIRDKKVVQVSVKLGNLTDESDEQAGAESGEQNHDKLGLIVGSVPDNSGVVVQDIAPNSAAGEAGILPGDILKKVNNTPVKDVKSYSQVVANIKSKQPVLMDLERQNLKLFVAFRAP